MSSQQQEQHEQQVEHANNTVSKYPILSMSHGLPITIYRITAETQHPIFIIDNFLTTEECDEVIRLGEPLLQTSTVVENNQLVRQTYRTSSTAFITPNGQFHSTSNTLKNIQKRITMFSWMPVAHLEALNLTRYLHQQYYRTHHDYFEPEDMNGSCSLAGAAGQRLCTFFIYLNDVPVEAGGATVFPSLNVRIQPKRGCCVFWPNAGFDSTRYEQTLHAAEPIIDPSVIKFGMNGWVRENSFV